MKFFTLTMMTFFLSISASAKTNAKATQKERSLLCTTIQKSLEESQSDVGINLKTCLKNKSIRSKLLQEGVREVSGQISLTTTSMTCKIAYEVEPEVRNIVSALKCSI